jgi:small subunit ribosomal protein S3Ae
LAAKKVSRATSKKLKDKWRAKQWYSIHAPDMFDNKEIPGTPADEPDKLMNRIVEVTMQELTGDFSKSYIKLKLRIKRIAGFDAYTSFIGHEFTSDYIRRLTRRRRTKIDGVFDVTTKDGYRIRVKPMAIAEHRIQSSQKVAIRHQMDEVVNSIASQQRMAEFVSSMIRGDVSRDIFRLCKPIYRLKRIDIRRSQVLGQLSTHRNVELEPEDIDAIPDDERIVGEDGEPIDIDAIPDDETPEGEDAVGEDSEDSVGEDADTEDSVEEEKEDSEDPAKEEVAPEEPPMTEAPEVAPEEPPVEEEAPAPVAEEPPVEEEAPVVEEAPAPVAEEVPEVEEKSAEPEASEEVEKEA